MTFPRTRRILTIGITLAVLFSNGFFYPTVSQSQELQIAATSSIVADALVNIAGDLIVVETLIPAGVDPHDYEPSTSDIALINSSDHIFFYGGEENLFALLEGLESEGKATNLIESIDQSKLIAGGEEDHGDEHGHGAFDPHYYLDPLLWKEAVLIIAEKLSAIDSVNAATYLANADFYAQELEDLHLDIVTTVDDLRENQRFIVTQHASFEYFARAYNFTTASLQGISTETEAGLQNIDQLANFIVDNDIKVVFTEDTSSSDDLEAVLDAARAQGHGVVVAGSLYVGSLGTTDETDSYIKLMQYNTDLIVDNILNPPEDTAVLNSPLTGWAGLFGLVIMISVAKQLSRRHEL